MPQITDWIAQTYLTNAAPHNASRCVNMFAEAEVQDAKSSAPVAVWGAPGTAPFAVCGNGPIIAFTVMGSKVYVVAGDGFYRIDPGGASTKLGDTHASPNGVSIDNNGDTIAWTDGFAGWIWSEAAGVRQITDPNFYPGYGVCFFDTFFAFTQRDTRTWYLSPQQWNGTDPLIPADATAVLTATKEATSDLLLQIVNVHEQLFLLGEKRIEVWFDAGNAPPLFPFQRSDGALIQRGLAAPYAYVLEDNTLFWLGDDLIFYRLNGFVPERISNHGCETKWQKYVGILHTKCFVFTLFGHKMIALAFPEARATWVVDLTTKRWHERESWHGDNADTSIGRWRVNCALNNSSSIQAYPDLLFGDSLTGRVDQANLDVFTEFGDTMRALLIGPPIHSDRKRIFMKRFEIAVENGVGLPGGGVITNEYCAQAVVMTAPTYIQTADALTGTPATFGSFVFSVFVHLPDLGDGNTRGLAFGNNHLWISLDNDESSGSEQIVVDLSDASGTSILHAGYSFTSWSRWLWIGISVSIPLQVVQLWVNDTTGDQQLTASTLTWSGVTTAVVPNDTGDPWMLQPQ